MRRRTVIALLAASFAIALAAALVPALHHGDAPRKERPQGTWYSLTIVSVFFKPGATREELIRFRDTIEHDPLVKDVSVADGVPQRANGVCICPSLGKPLPGTITVAAVRREAGKRLLADVRRLGGSDLDDAVLTYIDGRAATLPPGATPAPAPPDEGGGAS